MANNPHMKVLITSGYYDMATPYYATEYTFSHMDIESTLKRNVAVEYYAAGHMMYLVCRVRPSFYENPYRVY